MSREIQVADLPNEIGKWILAYKNHRLQPVKLLAVEVKEKATPMTFAVGDMELEYQDGKKQKARFSALEVVNVFDDEQEAIAEAEKRNAPKGYPPGEMVNMTGSTE